MFKNETTVHISVYKCLMSFIVSITKLSNKLFIDKFVADFQGRKRLKNKVKILMKAHKNQIFIQEDFYI